MSTHDAGFPGEPSMQREVFMKTMGQRASVAGVLAAMLLSGCGKGAFPTMPVTGRIVCEGEPVPFAMIYFEPQRTGESAIVGKPGFATADGEGRFVLGTYDLADGAVVGKHRVRVDRPAPGKNPPDWQCGCEMNANVDVAVVEVVDGENDFTIELVKSSQASRPRLEDDDEGEGED